MRWVIYYGDGATFTNEQGEPADALGGGVLAVVQEDAEVGRAVHQGSDFYVFAEQYGGWYGLDHFGFTQYLMRPGTKIVKLSESITTNRFREIIKDARTHPKLPVKSAFYRWETQP